MDPIVQAAELQAAAKALDKSSEIGNRLPGIIDQIAGMASSFLQLRAMATTDEGRAVFDSRLATAIATAKQRWDGLPADTQVLLTQVLQQLL